MKKKLVIKIILSIILVIILSGIFVVYTALNGNPIKIFTTSIKSKKYIEEQYKDKDFFVKDTFYNFKDMTYGSKIESKESSLEFNIAFRKDGSVYDQYASENYISDTTTMMRFKDKIEGDIKDALKRANISFQNVNAMMEIKSLKYPKNQEYNKDVTEPVLVTISINPVGSNEEFAKIVDGINNTLTKISINKLVALEVTEVGTSTNKSVVFREDELKLGKQPYNLQAIIERINNEDDRKYLSDIINIMYKTPLIENNPKEEQVIDLSKYGSKGTVKIIKEKYSGGPTAVPGEYIHADVEVLYENKKPKEDVAKDFYVIKNEILKDYKEIDEVNFNARQQTDSGNNGELYYTLSIGGKLQDLNTTYEDLLRIIINGNEKGENLKGKVDIPKN